MHEKNLKETLSHIVGRFDFESVISDLFPFLRDNNKASNHSCSSDPGLLHHTSAHPEVQTCPSLSSSIRAVLC